MKVYVDKRDLEAFKKVASGESELASINPWRDPSSCNPIELTITYKTVKKYKVSLYKRLKRAIAAFKRAFRKG